MPRIASSVFALSLGGMSGDGEARAAFRALLSTERAGYKLASALVSTLVLVPGARASWSHLELWSALRVITSNKNILTFPSWFTVPAP